MLQNITVRNIFNKHILLKITSPESYTLKSQKNYVSLNELEEIIQSNITTWTICKDMTHNDYFLNYWNDIQNNLNIGIENACMCKRNEVTSIINHILNMLSTSLVNEEMIAQVKVKGKIKLEVTFNSPLSSDIDFPKIYSYIRYASKKLALSRNIDSLPESLKAYIRFTKNPNESIPNLDSSYIADSIAALYSFREYLFSDKANWNRITNETLTIYRSILAKESESFKKTLNRTEDTLVAIEKHVLEKEKELDALEETYREKLKLEAPERLWIDQANYYLHSSRINLKFIAGVSALLLILLNFLVQTLFQTNLSVSWLSPTTILISIISFVLYIIRVLIKQFQSNKHLEIACRERAALTRFYQALVYETNRAADGGNSSITDNERLLIFKTLFTITDSGLVKTGSTEISVDNLLSLINPNK